jgi:RNA polymerase sigma factor (sigma-70 family)
LLKEIARSQRIDIGEDQANMSEQTDFIPTRQSLLGRLKDLDDAEGWKIFFETYWRLIYSTAIKAGLTDAEAQDVVQETVLAVSRNMPKGRYDSGKGSFKSWLLRLTTWRIIDQLRQRHSVRAPIPWEPRSASDTATLDRLVDPMGLELEAVWEKEWERNLVEAAVEIVKRKVDPKQYQVFDLHVLRDWPVTKVVKALGVSAGRVYLIKHRLSRMMRREIARLQRQPM